MSELPTGLQQFAVNIPFFGLFWYALKRIEKKDDQIENMNEKWSQLVEANTRAQGDNVRALGELSSVIKEQVEVGKTLNNRIYDVLTHHNGN